MDVRDSQWWTLNLIAWSADSVCSYTPRTIEYEPCDEDLPRALDVEEVCVDLEEIIGPR